VLYQPISCIKWSASALQDVSLRLFPENRVMSTAKNLMPRLLAIKAVLMLFVHDVGG
jgi:hypothetical protein